MFKKIILLTAVSALSANVSAGVITSVFDSSWTDMTNGSGEDITDFGSSSYVNPGWGGQNFDAEYLFYKLEGNLLSIGLQTGFDVKTGYQTAGSKNRPYYSGDLALSFDNDSSNYEFAVDFGLLTRSYWNQGDEIIEVDGDGETGGDSDGVDPAGLYENVTWDDRIHFGVSAPYAMTQGDIISGIGFTTTTGYDNALDSFYRTATFDISSFNITGLDAHWTMSCGNDAVDGHATVPEPSSLLLLSAGFLGLFGSLVATRKRKFS